VASRRTATTRRDAARIERHNKAVRSRAAREEERRRIRQAERRRTLLYVGLSSMLGAALIIAAVLMTR
jgi:hypothetical protein